MVYLICPISSCLTTTFNTPEPTQAHVTDHLVTHHNVTTPPDLISLLRERQQKVWQTRWDALHKQLDEKARLRMRNWAAFSTNATRGVLKEVDCTEEQMALFRLAEARDDEGSEGEEEEDDEPLDAGDADGVGDRAEPVGEQDGEVVDAAKILLSMVNAVEALGEEGEGEEDEAEERGDESPGDAHIPADQEANEDLALLQHFQRVAASRPGKPSRASRNHLSAGSIGGASPRQIQQQLGNRSAPTPTPEPTPERRRSSTSGLARRCPVPGCDVVRNRLTHINKHLRDTHGVSLTIGEGGNMEALRARQDGEWRAWCLRRKYRGDISRDQAVE